MRFRFGFDFEPWQPYYNPHTLYNPQKFQTGVCIDIYSKGDRKLRDVEEPT